VSGRLRVVAGEAGSVPLARPPAPVRPTSQRVREALFASLGELVVGRPFVDLYAGSGAMGIEALSRGASRCLFVERRRACVKVLKANLEKTRLAGRAEVWASDVRRVLERVGQWLAGEAAVVFADPPYADSSADEVLARLLDDNLPVGSLVVLEHGCRREPAGLPEAAWERKIAETCLKRWEV